MYDTTVAFVGDMMTQWLLCWNPGQEVWVWDWARSFCCVLKHDTLISQCLSPLKSIKFLLIRREGCTGEYWPKVVAVYIDPGQGGLYKYDQGPIFPSMTPSLRQTCLFWRQKTEICGSWNFSGNGPYGKIQTKEECLDLPKATLSYNENGYFLPANCQGIQSLMKC